MKKLLIISALLIGLTTQAQEYKKVGNQLVKVEQTKTKSQVKETELTVTIKDKDYKVFKGAKGGYFIWRTSKKTNKKYKQYLKVN